LLQLSLSTGVAAAQRKDSTARSFSAAYGVVVDSIHGGVLAGAVVRVTETDLQAVTDAKGYYRIDSVPPGAHRLSLHHPLLDTLGMEIGTQPIDFQVGRVPVVPLGTPSAEAMLDIACPKGADSSPEGSAGLLGIVRDPDTGVPAISAEVSLRWTEIRVSKEAGVRRSQRLRTTTVDSAGNYAICGLPSDLTGVVRAVRDNAYTAWVEITIADGAVIALRSLGLGASETIADTVNSTVHLQRRGPATLRGRVADSEGHPVAGARVEMPGTPQVALSDQSGAFTLAKLPAGTQAVLARSIGYEAVEKIVELSARTPRDITLTMRSVTVLPTVETQVAAAGLDKVGFTERKRTSMGRFLTHEEIEQRNPMVVTDLFSLMPGVRLTRDAQGNDVLQSSRAMSGEGNCTAVFVDRMQLHPPRPEQLVQHLNFMVRPEQVWAVEVYQASQVPGEFMAAGERCLTIVIWTRFGVGETQRNAPTP
jgi:hypothetical protein